MAGSSEITGLLQALLNEVRLLRMEIGAATKPKRYAPTFVSPPQGEPLPSIDVSPDRNKHLRRGYGG